MGCVGVCEWVGEAGARQDAEKNSYIGEYYSYSSGWVIVGLEWRRLNGGPIDEFRPWKRSDYNLRDEVFERSAYHVGDRVISSTMRTMCVHIT